MAGDKILFKDLTDRKNIKYHYQFTSYSDLENYKNSRTQDGMCMKNSNKIRRQRTITDYNQEVLH